MWWQLSDTIVILLVKNGYYKLFDAWKLNNTCDLNI